MTIPKNMKPRYCKKCGSQLIRANRPSNEYGRHGLFAAQIPGDKFDEFSGERLYRDAYICPKYKRIFGVFSGHANFAVGEPYPASEAVAVEEK